MVWVGRCKAAMYSTGHMISWHFFSLLSRAIAVLTNL